MVRTKSWTLAVVLVMAVSASVAAQTPVPLPSSNAGVVGEIRTFAFGGDDNVKRLASLGWVECAGQSFKKTDYPELHAALKDTWGSADGTNVFFLPDLRGTFLRGWHHGKKPQGNTQIPGVDSNEAPYKGDPDAAGRWPARPEIPQPGTPGNKGDLVGSVQRGDFTKHHHQFEGVPQPGDGGGAAILTNSSNGGAHTIKEVIQDNTGTTETRSNNAAVLYAIYVGRQSAIMQVPGAITISPLR
jgi:hypothetical protein